MYYRNGYEVRKEIIQEVYKLAIDKSINWNLQLQKDDIYIYNNLLSKDNFITKSESIFMGISALSMYELIYNIEQQLKWDMLCDEVKIIEEYDILNHIILMGFSAFTPSSPRRYFLLYRACSILHYPIEKNLPSEWKYPHYIISYKSIQHDHFFLNSENSILCECAPSGWVIIPLEMKDQQPCCKVIYIQQVDITVGFEQKISIVPSIFEKTGGLTGRLFQGLKLYIANNDNNNTENNNNVFKIKKIYQIGNNIIKELNKTFCDINQKKKEWKSQFKSSSIEILTWSIPTLDFNDYQKINRKVIAVIGYFFCESSTQDIFNLLSNEIKLQDIFFKNGEILDKLDENNKIIHFKDTIWNLGSSMNCVVLQIKRTWPGDINCIAFKSIENSNIDTIIEVLESGYYIVPSTYKNLSVISYCIQIINPYLCYDETTFLQILPIISAKIVSSINILRNQLRENNINSSSLEKELSTLNKIDPIEKNETKWIEIINFVVNLLNQEQKEIHELDEELLKSNENLSNNNFPIKKQKNNNFTSLVHVSDSMIWKLPTGEKPFLFLETNQNDFQKKKTIHYTYSYIDSLPDEILIFIFSLLDMSNLCIVSQVCKKFYIISSSGKLWKNLYISRWDLQKKNFENNNNNEDDKKEWKNLYIQKNLNYQKWKNGKYKEESMISHKKKIRCLQSEFNILISGSSDKTVKLWNINTNECISTISGPNSGVIAVSSLLNNEKEIIIGYHNGVIQKYNVESQQYVWKKQFFYLSEGFQFIKNKAISWDMSIEIWNLENDEREFFIKQINNSRIIQVQAYSSLEWLVASSLDKSFSLWDIPNVQMIKSFSGHFSSITCFYILNDYNIITGSNDKTLKYWDIRSSNPCISTFSGHLTGLKCIDVKNSIIMSNCSTNIKIWDFRMNSEKACQRTFSFLSPITCVNIFSEMGFFIGENSGVLKKVIFH